MVFFAFENIESISYTSILQRTFNLNIMARPTTSDETQEIELSMIDQANFGGIDTYVKKHGLQDASLAETRRAKQYNVNGGVKTEEGAEASAEDGGELQKAEREIEDQEDEEEEDYDPGSDGDTDGSGSSCEDEDEDGGGPDEEDEDEDLVADELGSEAEDVPGEEEL